MANPERIEQGRIQPVHNSVTGERVIKMMERDDNEGICLTCGADAQGVEPDARHVKCAACGDNAVYGAEEILILVRNL